LRGEDYTEIKDGIAAGDEVVVAANFLIDAESNLQAALAGFTAYAADKRSLKLRPEAAEPSSHSAHEGHTP
jgi:Cu(I)/Ag(I) efflux system membrane fusion protein